MEDKYVEKSFCRVQHEPITLQLNELNNAIFGDAGTGEIGMKKKVDEIYLMMTSGRMSVKIVIGFFMVISFIMGLIYSIVKVFK